MSAPRGAAPCKESFQFFHLYLYCGNLLPGGVYNEEVSVHGYQDDGEGGEEDTAGLGGPHQLAQDRLNRYRVGHNCMYNEG